MPAQPSPELDERPVSRAGVAGEIWPPALLIPLFAILAYAIGVSNGYVFWDDGKYIRFNPHMTAPDGLWRIWFTFESPQYYPLTFTSFWLEYRLWGPNATSYFVTNVLLHAANGVLVFAVARALGQSRAVAWLCGCLFAVHPIQVASVAWLAERKNVLSGVFALTSMLLYLRFARRGGARLYAGCLLAYMAALLSKTAVVTVPVSLLLAELLIFRRPLRVALRRVAPMILLAGVLAAAGLVALDGMIDRLAEDHANARQLARGLASIPGLTLDPDSIQTNIVIFHVDPSLGSAADLIGALGREGVKVGSPEEHYIRMVTHRHIDGGDVEETLGRVATVVKAMG
ncbi:MAG: hypothetical protein IIC97_01085 [Chloroflexi bacterium]|nr:hypothetical protein [Chloroflexota bacterium]